MHIYACVRNGEGYVTAWHMNIIVRDSNQKRRNFYNWMTSEELFLCVLKIGFFFANDGY